MNEKSKHRTVLELIKKLLRGGDSVPDLREFHDHEIGIESAQFDEFVDALFRNLMNSFDSKGGEFSFLKGFKFPKGIYLKSGELIYLTAITCELYPEAFKDIEKCLGIRVNKLEIYLNGYQVGGNKRQKIRFNLLGSLNSKVLTVTTSELDKIGYRVYSVELARYNNLNKRTKVYRR